MRDDESIEGALNRRIVAGKLPRHCVRPANPLVDKDRLDCRLRKPAALNFLNLHIEGRPEQARDPKTALTCLFSHGQWAERPAYHGCVIGERNRSSGLTELSRTRKALAQRAGAETRLENDPG
jgi:hypothetical protein